jgi:uncharacterized membrane protein
MICIVPAQFSKQTLQLSPLKIYLMRCIFEAPFIGFFLFLSIMFFHIVIIIFCKSEGIERKLRQSADVPDLKRFYRPFGAPY